MRQLARTVLVLLIGLNATAHASDPVDPGDHLRQFQQELDLVSVSAVLVDSTGITWHGAVGKADLERGIDVTTDHLNTLGSVSKLFTGTAFLTLVDRGLAGLDDDVSRHLPFTVRHPGHPDTPITFRMLLTHTAGIADRQTLQDSLYGSGDPAMSLAEISRAFFAEDGRFHREDNYLDHAPGTVHDYSNWNYVLVGYAVERLTGMLFNDYCRLAVLDPLRMETAGWLLDEIDESRLVTLYRRSGSGEQAAVDPRYSWPGYCDGNLRASVTEASSFLVMLLGGGRYGDRRVLEASTVDEMLQGQRVPNLPAGALVDLGLGWFIYDLHGTVRLHTGEPAGSLMVMLLDTETRSGFVSCITGIALASPAKVERWVAYLAFMREKAASLAAGGD